MLSKLSTICRWVMVGLIVFLSGILMFNAARGDSAIIDELANIPAGYAYIRYFDYRLNPEQPPLVKVIAALPLLFQNLNFPLNISAWIQDVNGQLDVGSQFLYQSGNNADTIIFWSRIGPIILTLILVVLMYLFARRLMGRWWALLPAFLFAFSPAVLAYGHYAATDVGAALGIFVSVVAFLQFIFSQTKRNLILVGLAFGFAQLTEFSAAILVPYLVILTAIFYFVDGFQQKAWNRFWHYARSLILLFAIGYLLVYAVYFLTTLNYPVGKQASDIRIMAPDLGSVPFADSSIFRPLIQYLAGLLMFIRQPISGPWYDPIIAFFFKEPISSLVLILTALMAALAGIFGKLRKPLEYLSTYFPEFAMIVFVVFYFIGVARNSILILPFVYILTAGVVKKWFSIDNLNLVRNFVIKILVVYSELFTLSIKSAALVMLLLWYLASALWASPNFLSYHNFFGGRFINSDRDLGQDLKRLAKFVETENIDRIAVDYFGGGSPKYYLGDERAELWWSARGNPDIEGVKWLAVSARAIQNAKGQLAPGSQRNPEDEYQWLKEPYKPYARAGTSIFVYKLEIGN